MIKTESKFKEYDRISEEWKKKYMIQENDYLFEELMNIFRKMIS